MGPVSATVERDGQQEQGFALWTVSEEGPGGRKSYPLEGERISVGREDTDILLRHPEVSRRHALFTRDGDGFRLDDLGSTNGTWVDGRRLEPGAPIRLRGGERVRFAVMEFVFGPTSEEPDLPAERLAVGRDPAGQVVLSDDDVSWNHCVLERTGDGWILRDLNSANGTWLNGQPCETAAVRDGDLLRVGSARFVFRSGRLVPCLAGREVRIDVCGLRQELRRRGRSPVLLEDVSFTVYPNELVAIVGASGAGKSTLINALTGLRPASHGAVYYNGVSFYDHLESLRAGIGYVPQEDIIHRELTVSSVLHYAARLRLPPDTPAPEIETLIEEVLAELSLEHRRQAVVSTLSGGERKRVNIGVELLTRPSLLLLDEPTSGLDPGLERRVVALIRRLTDEGRTVLFVTHATESIAQCDLLLFLARGGRVAFFGPPRAALEFFGVTEFAEAYVKLNAEEDEVDWPARFRESEYYDEYVRQRGRELAGATAVPAPPPPPRVAPLAQFATLARRYAEVLRGDPRNVLILLLQAPFIALILALIYGTNTFTNEVPTAPGASPPVKDAPELLFLLVIAALWFGTVNSARELTKERAIYIRERLVNLRLWPYLFSKLALLSGLCLVQSSLLLGIVGARIPFNVDPATWGQMLLTLFLASLASTLLGLALSAFAHSSDQAMSLVPVALLPQVIFSGMLIGLDDLGPLRAVSNVVPGRWAYGGLAALAGLPDRFEKVGIGRHVKDVFDTSPTGALLALGTLCGVLLLAAWCALALRETRPPR